MAAEEFVGVRKALPRLRAELKVAVILWRLVEKGAIVGEEIGLRKADADDAPSASRRILTSYTPSP